MTPKIVIHSILAQDRGLKASWLLNEMKIPYEIEKLDIENVPKSYFKIHPMGMAPSMNFDGRTMYESTAMLAFLADYFPEKGFAPVLNSPERALYLQWLFFSEASLDRLLSRLWLTEDFPGAEKTEKYSELRDDVNLAFRAIEEGLQESDYLIGDSFSAADIAVYYYLKWADTEKLLEGRERLQRYVARVGERPALQESLNRWETA